MKKNNSQIGLNKGSWSNKYGVSKQNNGSPVFGLNPNLNIEDEYIENLLKQIHFMNMQVKLLKQKQQQSEGNSLWGVINRSSQPLVNNIVDSNQKYQTMKKQVDGDLNKNQYENIKLADLQNAILHKLNYLQKRISLLQAKKIQTATEAKNKQEKINEKIGQYQTKLKNLLSEKDDETKKNNQLTGQYEALIHEVEKQKFASNNDMNKIKNQQDIQQIINNEKTQQIQSLNDRMQKLRESIQGSLEFQRAKQDQNSIRENMAKILKNIAVSQFQLMQIESSIKLATQERQKQVMDRKKLMEQFQSLKIVLQQLQTLNSSRFNLQISNRKRQSIDIQKGQTQSKKLQKNLQQLKKKLSRSQDSQKSLRQQVEYQQRELLKLKQKRNELNDQLNKLITSNDKQDTNLTNCRNQYRKVQEQYEKIVQSELVSTIDLNQIETQVIFLRERKEYLTQVLNLKEALNQTKLEELQKVVQKNRDVNQTVGILMDKWEEIRNFSKI